MFLFFSQRRNKSQRWNTKVHAALLACWHSNCQIFVHHKREKSWFSEIRHHVLFNQASITVLWNTKKIGTSYCFVFNGRRISFMFVPVRVNYTVLCDGRWNLRYSIMEWLQKNQGFLSAQFRRTEALLSNVAHSCCSMLTWNIRSQCPFSFMMAE